MLHAQTLYTLDMTQDDTGDFNLYQIGGTFGQAGVQTNQRFTYNSGNDTYTLDGRYNQDRTAILAVTLDTPPTPPAGFSVPPPAGWIDGDVAITLNFNYINNAGNSDVIVAVRQGYGQTNYTVNNYPNYYIRVLDNSAFSLVELDGTGGITTHGSTNLTGLTGSENYRIEFSALNSGTDVILNAAVFADNVQKGTLSYTDANGLTGGYTGLAAGQGSTNDDTYEGINITGYTVAIPEPSSMALLAGALAGLLVMRRRRH
jgi:hypothetical protein